METRIDPIVRRDEFNFVSADLSEEDIGTIMGPLEPEDGPFVTIAETWTMAHIMHAAGIFPSVGQARRNGWDRPVPTGFSEFTVTKRRMKIFIMKTA